MQVIDMLNKSDKQDDELIWPSVSVIAFYLVSEFLPNFFALDYSFMMSYLKNEDTAKLIWTSSPEDRLLRITSPKHSMDETVFNN